MNFGGGRTATQALDAGIRGLPPTRDRIMATLLQDWTLFPSAEGEGVVIGALDAAAGNGPAAGHVNHVADDGDGGAVQSVARDRHRRERLPGIGFRIVGLVGAEHTPSGLAAENDDLAVDIDA